MLYRNLYKAIGLGSLLCLAPCLLSTQAVAQNSSASNTSYELEEVRGVVSALKEATISAEIKARVEKTPALTGDSFMKGDVLIEFDCTVRKAEAAAVDAAYKAARARYDNSVELQELDAAGAFDVKIAKAEKSEAHAHARAIHARNKQCTIKAPYDGKVSELIINAHEIPASDQPLIRIVGSESLELRLIVPSKWLVWIKSGQEFTFKVDETGEQHAATIRAIGAEVDAVSRTVAVIATFNTTSNTVLPGMSGAATFQHVKG